MENYENNYPHKEKKKFPAKAVAITAVITSVCTLFLVLGTNFLTSYLLHKVPFFASVFSLDSSSVEREVRAYIDSVFLYDINEDDLKYGAAKGMVEALGDPYTRYLTPGEFTEYLNDSQGNYIGIGVIFTINENDEIMVIGSYPGSPGSKSGIESGDLLISVDSKPCNLDNYEEIISYIRGEHIDIHTRENTQFEMEYLKRKKDGSETKHKVTLTRKTIHVNSVSHEIIGENIGYITVSGFNSDTHTEFDNAYNELLALGMEELIIDLRDNGGGDFNVAIEMAGRFLENNSLVVYTLDRDEKKTQHFSNEKKYEIKPVILVNGNSASASEVFTGALRDHEKTKAIVGTQSFGKGITQNVYSMMSGGGLIVTVDTYYTPCGDSIHEKGITPTDIIEISEPYNQYPASYYTDEIDTQKAHAITLLKNN